MNFKQTMLKLAAVATLAAAVSACSTPTKVSSEGTTDNPVWPKWDSVTFNKDRGTFPNLTSLREVKAGVTKDQLYYLLGRPHYDEVWRPREWNYLFHFHTPGVGTDGVTTCQFKVLFDSNKIARSFYWNSVDPIDGACPAVLRQLMPPTVPAPVIVQAPPQPAQPQPKLQRYTLNADALFAFDKYTLDQMNAAGRQELDRLAEVLKKFDRLDGILVVGHTDYLGTDEYNMVLSRRRADTVARYLMTKGVPAGIMRSFGAGEHEPVKQCVDTGNRPELKRCLQPNRRVEVIVDGSGILDGSVNPAEVQILR